MLLVEPPHLLLEALDPLLLLGEPATDVLEPLVDLLVGLGDLLVMLLELLRHATMGLELFREPAGHLLDVAVEITGVLLEATVDLVRIGATRTGLRLRRLRLRRQHGPAEQLRANGPAGATEHRRATGVPGLRARLGMEHRTTRHRPPGLRTGKVRRGLRRDRAVRTGATETGLDRLELAEDQLELLRDMGVRIGMGAGGHPLELHLPAVDLDGDRTVHRPGRANHGGDDFDPLGDTVRPDLQGERANLRRCPRRSVEHRRCGWRHPKWLTGPAVRPGAARRLGASGIRWAVIEGTTPPGPRAVSFGTGPITAAIPSAVLTLVVVFLRAWPPPITMLRLLEKSHEGPDRIVSATVRTRRSGGITGCRRHGDTSEHERCGEKGNSAATKRTMHDDTSFWKRTGDELGSGSSGRILG